MKKKWIVFLIGFGFIVFAIIFLPSITDRIYKIVGKKYSKYGFVKYDVLREKISRLDQMIKDNPADAANYLSRGMAYANNFYYDFALKDFQKAISINPNLPIANNYIGSILIGKGKYNMAESYLKKAIGQSPNFSKPYFNLSRIYLHRKDWNNAKEQITKAIECEPNFYEAYILRAQIYYKSGQYEKVIKDLEMAMKINPSLKRAIENKIKIIQSKIKKNVPN